jgi:hypothetical protein
MSRGPWPPAPFRRGHLLAFRRDEMDDDPEDVLRLAIRAEYDGHPPDNVRRWLEEQGVPV